MRTLLDDLIEDEAELKAFNKATRTIPGEQPLTWNQALQENMLRPYAPPQPEYEEMLFAPADWTTEATSLHSLSQ